ncbi:hypothetical protein ERJ75_000263600 [Trypanosoma vivax]|nr:hypothetical protein ERJ75_000263600 [Trypanosoma vivax]
MMRLTRATRLLGCVLCCLCTVACTSAEKAQKPDSEEHRNAARKVAGLYKLYNDTFLSLEERVEGLMRNVNKAVDDSRKLEEILSADNGGDTAEIRKSIEAAQRDAKEAHQEAQLMASAASGVSAYIDKVLNFTSTFVVTTKKQHGTSKEVDEDTRIISWRSYVIKEGITPVDYEEKFARRDHILQGSRDLPMVNKEDVDKWTTNTQQLLERASKDVANVADAFVRPIVEKFAEELEKNHSNANSSTWNNDKDKRVKDHIATVKRLLGSGLLDIVEKEFKNVTTLMANTFRKLDTAQISERKVREEERERKGKKEERAEQERKRKEEEERAEQERKKKKEEEERAEQERKRKEEEERAEQERKRKEEEERAEQERKRKEEEERAEQERKKEEEEEERAEQERKRKKEEEERAEQERKRKEEEERAEQERKRKEEEERAEQERKKRKEEEERAEQERKRKEEEERAEQERKRKEEEERAEQERKKEEEEEERAEQERKRKKEEEERAEQERKRKEEEERLSRRGRGRRRRSVLSRRGRRRRRSVLSRRGRGRRRRSVLSRRGRGRRRKLWTLKQVLTIKVLWRIGLLWGMKSSCVALG